MKSLLLAAVLFVAVTSAMAQFSLGLHVNPAFPLSDFSNDVQTGFGFNVEGRYRVSDPFSIGVGIGLEAFEQKGNSDGVGLPLPLPLPDPNSPRYTGIEASCEIIPVVFSLMYSLRKDKLEPYLMLGLGANRVLIKSLGFKVADLHFGLSPGFGVRYHANRHFSVDLNVEYQLILDSINDPSIPNFYGFVNDISYVPFNLGAFYTFGQ